MAELIARILVAVMLIAAYEASTAAIFDED